ncbi:hypothetical protein [Parasitella parasitica]|uniref:Chromo domain-containing protein n=1 Tax=Parasitella parasitica TaxID=35722 RepID=A0A0B7NG67_9FUNG|nr:hypothetical protein [Parasitella parasitica]
MNESPDPIDEQDPTEIEYEVQAILNYRDKEPNYLVRWKGFDSSWDTWEVPANFDSKEPIKLYWSRHGAANADSNTKRKRAPKLVNERRVATREERSSKRHARLIYMGGPTTTP